MEELRRVTVGRRDDEYRGIERREIKKESGEVKRVSKAEGRVEPNYRTRTEK